jgi:hypothetical protein
MADAPPVVSALRNDESEAAGLRASKELAAARGVAARKYEEEKEEVDESGGDQVRFVCSWW